MSIFVRQTVQNWALNRCYRQKALKKIKTSCALSTANSSKSTLKPFPEKATHFPSPCASSKWRDQISSNLDGTPLFLRGLWGPLSKDKPTLVKIERVPEHVKSTPKLFPKKATHFPSPCASSKWRDQMPSSSDLTIHTLCSRHQARTTHQLCCPCLISCFI
jgi:hypothetical protein